jgi:hypothetical protein
MAGCFVLPGESTLVDITQVAREFYDSPEKSQI